MGRSISSLRGVGTKTAKLYSKIGIETVEDLLIYYPRDYDVFREPVKIKEISEGKSCAVEGMVIKTPEKKEVRNLQVITTVIRDESGVLDLI